MAGNETTINARITLDATAMQRVPGAFSPATAAANQFGQAAQRAGVAMDTLGAKAQRAMRLASRAGRAARGIGNVVGSIDTGESPTGQAVQGAITTGFQGAAIGAGIGATIGAIGGPPGIAIGGAIGGAVGAVGGAIYGAYTSYSGASAQQQQKATEAMVELTRQLRQMQEVMVYAKSPDESRLLAGEMRRTTAEIEKLVAQGASKTEVEKIIAAEFRAEQIEELASRIGKAVEDSSAPILHEVDALGARNSDSTQIGVP